MSKIVKSKFKRSRTLGVSLWSKDNDAYNFRNYAPGQHGQSVMRKISPYSLQLRAKQRLRAYYNILEKQFRKIFIDAHRLKGDSGENLVSLLEMRLDAVVYRSSFASTIFAASQMVSHGHILVNGRRVNIRSYRLKIGDVVSLSEKAKKNDTFKVFFSSSSRKLPDYLELDKDSFSVKLARKPSLPEVPYEYIVEPQLIVEYYSNKIG